MAPKDDLAPSSLGFKYPLNRDALGKGGDLWLEDKRRDDGAEGYWRIHDNLYDLNEFIDEHPGGKMWLELTKGTDVTEAFEVHHLTAKPQNMLEQFYIKKAKTVRSSPYTFKDDGFYRTLKRNVCSILDTIPKTPARKSDLLADFMLVTTFILCISSCYFWSYALAVPAGIVLTWTAVIGHNYFHRKDNFRMYYFDLSLMESREWRISHALSHHLLTNTIQDLEISIAEPILQYLPTPKTPMKKITSWLLSPVVWVTLFHISLLKRIVPALIAKDVTMIRPTNIIPLTIPLSMWWFGGQSILAAFGMWTVIILAASTAFGMVGFNAAHHHPDIFHDGDAVREDKDWGIAQLDSVMDRKEISGNQFLVLTNFGDHGLHHLFPTLDQGLLQYLYPVFHKTCKEFGIDLRITTQFELIKGQFKQLRRTEPNKHVPSLLKKY